MEEIWKKIEGYPDYEISSMGRVKSWKKTSPRILKPYKTVYGYLQVTLSHQNKSKKSIVHRLVCDAFIGPEPDMEVNHINCKKDDNRLSNLEWVTSSENKQHAIKSGLIDSRGESSSNSKLTSNEVLKSRELYVDGFTIKEIISLLNLNINRASLQDAINGVNWSHLSPSIDDIADRKGISLDQAMNKRLSKTTSVELTEHLVREVRELYKSGISIPKIKQKLGLTISRNSIHCAAVGKSFQWVK